MRNSQKTIFGLFLLILISGFILVLIIIVIGSMPKPEIKKQIVKTRNNQITKPQPQNNDIIKDVEQKINNSEELDDATKKKFLQYAADMMAEEMLTSDNLDKPSEKLAEMLKLVSKTGEDVGAVFMEPHDIKEFNANKNLRKVCVGTIFTGKNKLPFLVMAGNSCDEKSLEKGLADASKEAIDTKRESDARAIGVAEELYYGDNREYTNDYNKLEFATANSNQYNIFLDNNKQHYCISVILESERRRPMMQKDDGNDPTKYEVGNGCKK